MKRSTTPAIKERTSMVKSTANLKLNNQIKILNKDPKKTTNSRLIPSNQQNSVL